MDLEQLDTIIYKEYPNIGGLVILQHGKTIVNRYYQNHQDHDALHVASITKSIISALIGIAIDHGYIDSVHQTVLDFFPNYKVKHREKTIQKITIEHLLTMTAPYKYKSEPYSKVLSSNDWTKSSLDLLGGRSEIGQFRYSTVCLQILSGIISNATNSSVKEFATSYFFKPLEISVPPDVGINSREEYMSFIKANKASGWVVDPQGIHTAGWGIALSTVDLSKIGQLYLNMGNWKNQQIISERWIKKSTSIHSTSKENAYGYLWWIIDEAETYAAIGDGGNIIYIDKKISTVIVITSLFHIRAKNLVEFIQKNILPSYVI